MSKLSKIFFIIGILIISLLYSSSISFAATADMNLSSSSTQSASTSTSTKSTNTSSTKSTQYSTAVSASNFGLQLTNILSICPYSCWSSTYLISNSNFN